MTFSRQPPLTRFLAGCITRNANNEEFVPNHSIDQYITHEIVRAHITVKFPSYQLQTNDILNTIVQKASRLFSILVYCELEHLVFGLIESGVSDNSLPYFSNDDLPQYMRSRLSESRSSKFLATQWKFLAPTFKLTREKFENDRILPILSAKIIGGGMSGFVHEVAIAPGYIATYPQKDMPIIVARKTVAILNEQEDFKANLIERERIALERLLSSRHHHIIPLLASYTHRNNYCMLMPRARMNLWQFFDGKTTADWYRPLHTHGLKDAMYTSICCLISALAFLHNLPVKRGLATESIQALSHHDLKPQNLLVFEDRIVIADFGLSSLNAVDYTKTELQGTTYTYGPPELFGKPPVKFGRKADIWSMACVFLEIMSFVSHGLHGGGVERFSQRRKDGPSKHLFSTSEDHESEDKSFHNNMDVVELWLEELDQRQAYDKDEVGRDMVKIIVRMMNLDPDSRPSSLEAERLFQRIAPKLQTGEVCECCGN